MGQSKRLHGFITGIASNAAWEWIKKDLGGPIMTAALLALWQKIKHGSVDWYAIVGLFVIASAFLTYSHWHGREGSRLGNDQQKAGLGVALGDAEADVSDQIKDAAGKWAHEHNANVVVKAGVQALDLFTPLQMEAFQLVSDIKAVMTEAGRKPGVTVTRDTSDDAIWQNGDVRLAWRMKFLSAYKVRFSSRVAIVASGFWGHEVGSSRLENLYKDPKDEKDLDTICALLISQAHRLDGIVLEVLQ